MNCNYKVKITDIQTKYKFKVFCTGYDDSEIKEKIDAMYQAWPKASAEGETPTLDNTANATMSIDLKGNTSQETTTGKNLNAYPYVDTTKTTNGITWTDNGDGTLTVNGTNSGTATAYFNMTNDNTNPITLPAGTYTASLGSASNVRATIARYDNMTTVIATIPVNTSGKTFTLTEETQLTFILAIDKELSVSNVLIKPMIETGSTATDYEKYTGGVASPNPDYPQDVHVVTGDNEINVVGKNILENTFQSQTANGITFTRNENGSLSFSGTATQAHSITGRFTKNLVLRAGTTYILSLGNKQAGYGVYLQKEGSTNVWYLGVGATNSNLTITPTEDTTIIQVAIHFPNGNTVNGTIYPMLEVGSSATTYEPYQSQSYSINLGSMELCKIGNYQDYFYKDSGKWHLHKEIGKVVLNGSETISSYVATSLSGSYQATFETITKATSTDKIILSNYFTSALLSDRTTKTNICYTYTDGLLRIATNLATTTADFKTWLASNNVTIYYVLATPTTTEITDATLISQLNALAEAESYSGQTNISQTNDDKPFIITAKALKDLSNL